MPRRRTLALGLAALVLLAAGGCSGAVAGRAVPDPASMDVPQAPAIDAGLLASLPTRPNPTVTTSRLAPGVLPPTNRWFSGLAFGDQPMPVFPLPLTFQPATTGFRFGLPDVHATADTITGGFTGDVTVALGTDDYRITAYDALSVTLEFRRSGQPVGSLTVAEGAPSLWYRAAADQSVALPAGFAPIGDGYGATVGRHGYGLGVHGGKVTGATIALRAGDRVTFVAAPQASGLPELLRHTGTDVSGTRVGYAVTGPVTSTRLDYLTSGGPTVFAALPGQDVQAARVPSLTYDSILGPMPAYLGSSFRFDVPTVAPGDQLDLAGLSGADRDRLTTDLRKDAATTTLRKTDTYFGGKELYRAANLYQLAGGLGVADVQSTLHATLAAGLADWLDPAGGSKRANRFFYYDSTVKGLVGAEPSFGSDQFNDHHFHYGYLLYAAAVLAEHDPAFLSAHRAFVDLIAADIASTTQTPYFPQRRNFDAYAGHSWASGTSPFADGNNQESVSEALNAWDAVALWARVTADDDLAREATWMLSREAAAAQRDWLGVDTAAPSLAGYAHSVVSLNWGGKRDFATWFSADPVAKLGIQLIPMNPSMAFLRNQGGRITQNITGVLPGGSYGVQFGDYLLMYRALVDRAGALAAAGSLPDSAIDDGNSRSYLTAWIMSQPG